MRRIEYIMSDLLGNTPQTYFNWKKQNRPIVTLLNKYFSKEELEEFLRDGKIEKFETYKSDKFLRNKILRQFFYTDNGGSDNIYFKNIIFPKFDEYLKKSENESNSNRGVVKDKDKFHFSEFINKKTFYQFLAKTMEELPNKNIGSFVDDISRLTEYEFFIIITEYKEYFNIEETE